MFPSHIHVSQGDGAQESLPQYAGRASATPNPTLQTNEFPPPQPAKSAVHPTPNPQRYSSLLSQSSGSTVQACPPPSYESATSSLPDHSPRRHRRSEPATPSISDLSRPDQRSESPEPSSSRWSLRIPQRLKSSKPPSPPTPPQPEGVPLEQVVDRFGNRTRVLRMRPFRERMRDGANVRAALRNAFITSNFTLAGWK